MKRAYQKGAYTTWGAALEEALRLDKVRYEKFGPSPHDWKYQVIKRRNFGHDLWRVYTTGRVPTRMNFR